MRALIWVWAAGGTLAAVGFALAVSSQPAALSVLNLFTVALAIVAVTQELWLRRNGRPRTDPALVAAQMTFVLVTAALRKRVAA